MSLIYNRNERMGWLGGHLKRLCYSTFNVVYEPILNVYDGIYESFFY